MVRRAAAVGGGHWICFHNCLQRLCCLGHILKNSCVVREVGGVSPLSPLFLAAFCYVELLCTPLDWINQNILDLGDNYSVDRSKSLLGWLVGRLGLVHCLSGRLPALHWSIFSPWLWLIDSATQAQVHLQLDWIGFWFWYSEFLWMKTGECVKAKKMQHFTLSALVGVCNIFFQFHSEFVL